MTSFMSIKVFSVLSMFLKLSMLPPRVCWRRRGGGGGGGGGGQQASCLVAKQAVEFPQVLASTYYYYHTFQGRNQCLRMQGGRGAFYNACCVIIMRLKGGGVNFLLCRRPWTYLLLHDSGFPPINPNIKA